MKTVRSTHGPLAHVEPLRLPRSHRQWAISRRAGQARTPHRCLIRGTKSGPNQPEALAGANLPPPELAEGSLTRGSESR